MATKIMHWFIDESEVLNIIASEGYRYVNIGNNWYDTDYPIEFNGSNGLLRSSGTHLTALSDEQLEEKKRQEFDSHFNQ